MTDKITVSREFLQQVQDLIEFQKEWIDAVPSTVQLPAMPGFDGDWAAEVIDTLQAVVKQPAVMPANEWRKLAHQFDAQRMQALWHLKAMIKDPYLHMPKAIEFLSTPPPQSLNNMHECIDHENRIYNL